jgi:hypothetical protein
MAMQVLSLAPISVSTGLVALRTPMVDVEPENGISNTEVL